VKIKKPFTLIIITIIFLSSLMWWNQWERKSKSYGIYSERSIDYTKKSIRSNEEPYLSAYKQLISLADKSLESDINPVVFLRVPSANKNKQGHVDASKPLTEDAYHAYILSLAWKLTNKQQYEDKAKKILDAWANNNRLISHKEDTPLVSSYGGVGLINAALLLKDDENWNQSSFRTWVRTIYLPAIEVARNRENNWGAWGNLASLTSYSYLDDENSFQKEVKYTKQLINNQIGVDGEMLKEIPRKENSMFYTYFGLAPLTQSMYMIYNQTKVNMFDINTPEGAKIKRALDYYYYFVEHPDEWPHYREANLNKPFVPQDGYWPISLYEAMSKVYPKSRYNSIVSKYRPILGGYLNNGKPHHMAWNFPTLMPPDLEKASQ